jgi:hypothetical protein
VPAARSARAPVSPPAGSDRTPAAWDGGERRGPNRATNVARLSVPAKPAAAAATGTDDDWESF